MIEALLIFVCVHLIVDADIHRHRKQADGDFGKDVMYNRYTTNHRHHKYNTNHLNNQPLQLYAAKASDYDLLIAQQELRDILRAQHQYAEDDDDEWEEMDATSAWLRDRANAVVIAANPEPLFVVENDIIMVKWPKQGGGVDDPQPFTWHEYKLKLDEGVLTEAQKQSVYGDNGLRIQTQMELLKYSCTQNGLQFNLICYVNIGSLTAKSDLDFSYIRWEAPKLVVPSLVTFYNQHFIIMGDWPFQAFDMNFYIATGFIKSTPTGRCWATLHGQQHDNVRRLFTKIWDNGKQGLEREAWYEFAGQYKGSKAALYEESDIFMAYTLLLRRFKFGLQEGSPEERTINLIRLSEIFYSKIDLIKNNALLINSADKLDRMKIYLKTYLYLMNYWSDESYISLQALQFVAGKSVDKISKKGTLLAVLDNIAFINHFHLEITKNPRDYVSDPKDSNQLLLWFWNEISKYIFRFMKLFHDLPEEYDRFDKETKLYGKQIMKLYGLAYQWQQKWPNWGSKKIRGDVPFQYLLELDPSRKPPTNDLFLQNIVPKARRIWGIIRNEMFPLDPKGESSIDQLYGLINRVQVWIKTRFYEIPFSHQVALTKIEHEIEKQAESLTQITLGTKGGIKEIVYKSLTTKEAGAIKNPFDLVDL